MSAAHKGNGLPHRPSVYDGKAHGWAAIHHESPDEILADLPIGGCSVAGVPFSGSTSGETRNTEHQHTSIGAAALVQGIYAQMEEHPVPGKLDLIRQRDVWKTLVRYVWLNAKSVTGACIYFGIAARHIEMRYERRMLPAEVQALNCESTHKWNRARRLFAFRDGAVFRTGEHRGHMEPMKGYTPLAALLQGEHGEWRSDHAEQEKRRAAIQVILRAAWQDIESRKWEKTLRHAFKNFTALTGEDRDLLAWVTQTEFGKAFIETRAAVCARRKRKVRVPLELNGCSSLTAPGGKSESAIEVYREVQKDNHNRASGHAGSMIEKTTLNKDEHAEALRSLKDHADVTQAEMKPELRGLRPKELRAYLRAVHEAAERKRLGALCGCEAEDISLSKINPTNKDHE